MNPRVLLLTPPFTQLNTPYPATCYLKGFLNTMSVPCRQADLGLEVILALFSKRGLQRIFDEVEHGAYSLDADHYRTFMLRAHYENSIDSVIHFLQHRNPTLAHKISHRTFLPEGKRFEQLVDTDWAFGNMGIQDQARHIATLYLEDIGDFIVHTIDPDFGFSRYAERLGRAASDFEPIEAALHLQPSIVTELLWQKLDSHIEQFMPDLVGVSVPFPGNLVSGFHIAQYIKKRYPHIKTVLGGGYPNTELRSLSDPRVFNYFDFVSLDDGERPLLSLIEHLQGNKSIDQLKRCFILVDGVVTFINNYAEKDIPQRAVGIPDYSDLLLSDYLSVIEVTNPMHRLWSDGRWNKLTLAHGCYWGKCSFCDISLDYIKRYEPITAPLLVDRIEAIIAQTGETGFHFVDEAAPPALMRDLAIEILRRNLSISWWTNIRFEEKFTEDLCRLLKATGCIAVSGGLEVASDRLLSLMKKGVTVSQVARVAEAFGSAGVMVHAYLMYGFPTQSDQETVDSLEMVRQLFEAEVIQSGFWHQFAMTAHSPVGLNPDAYQVKAVGPQFKGFAHNDLYHEDPTGADHERYSAGLSRSLFNYMNNIGIDLPLDHWFDFKTPRTSISPQFIAQALISHKTASYTSQTKFVWLGGYLELEMAYESNEDAYNSTIVSDTHLNHESIHNHSEAIINFYQPKELLQLQTSTELAQWIIHILSCSTPANKEPNYKPLTMDQIRQSYMTLSSQPLSWEVFLEGQVWALLISEGLVGV